MTVLLRGWFLVLAFLAPVLGGCGAPSARDRPTGVVSGTVEKGGQPLAAGVVLLEDEKRAIGVTATIAEGKFRFTDPVPTGEYRIAIQPPPAPPPMQSGPTPPKIEIPPRYLAAKTSGFSTTVKEGENEPLKLTLDEK